ncbi:MAG: hypothetical protein JRH19_25270 [Deltaproteobacteria bacterium]|nr:hypothetical protein [Deltaproteobacteria bacterium]
MVVEFEKLPQGEGLLITARGTVAAADFWRIQELVNTKERFPGLRFVLVDLSDVPRLESSVDEVRDLAEGDMAASLGRQDLLIAVVGAEDIVFGLARMWAAYAETPGLKPAVFRSLSEAKAWITETLGQDE